MAKKYLFAILSFGMAFLLIACSQQAEPIVSAPEIQPTADSTEEPTPEVTPEPSDSVSLGREVIEYYNDPSQEGVVFLDAIEPFTGDVTSGELSDSAKQLLAAEPRYSDLTANCLTVDGTPLYEVFENDGTEKPLVLLLHGGGGSKDDFSAMPAILHAEVSMLSALTPLAAGTARRGRWTRWPVLPKQCTKSTRLLNTITRLTAWTPPILAFTVYRWGETLRLLTLGMANTVRR